MANPTTRREPARRESAAGAPAASRDSDRPRWFGRARHLPPKARVREMVLDKLFAASWPARFGRPLGLAGRFGVSRHDLRLAGWPSSLPPLTVAFASDFHAGPGTHPAHVARACDALEESGAQLILLGGDFVSFHARHVRRVAERLARLRAPLGAYAVLGNHDLMADDRYIVRRLADAGVRVLVNENVRLPAPYDRVWLCGLDDHDQGAPDAEAAFAGADGVRIALLHSPDSLAQIGEREFAIAFMGHVHGGQFWIAPDRSLVHRRGALSRLYQRGGVFPFGPRADRLLLVSRGIGQTTLPLRRGADPEVHICTLGPAGS